MRCSSAAQPGNFLAQILGGYRLAGLPAFFPFDQQLGEPRHRFVLV